MCVGSDKEEVGNKDRKPNNAKKKKKLRRISNYLVKINNYRISDWIRRSKFTWHRF